MISVGWMELLIILAGVLVLIGAMAIVAVIVLASRGRQSASSRRKSCPYCAELIRAEAKVCRFCGRDLPPSD